MIIMIKVKILILIKLNNNRHHHHHHRQIGVLKQYEKWHSSWLRNKAMEETIAQMVAEDKNTKYICIGPVNKTLNMLCMYFHYGKDHPSYALHCDRLKDYLWLANDGMKMQGYNGSQLWDTAFSVQAIVETG